MWIKHVTFSQWDRQTVTQPNFLYVHMIISVTSKLYCMYYLRASVGAMKKRHQRLDLRKAIPTQEDLRKLMQFYLLGKKMFLTQTQFCHAQTIYKNKSFKNIHY